ncbi:MAG: hypothetical protein H7Z12_18920 [Rhodospirillaceae bacterium]|nr:hypothetical protein [Rhodospirillales bacterium]
MSDDIQAGQGPSRRLVLGGLTGMAAVALLPGCASRDTGCAGTCPSDFVAASARLTGIELNGTYAQLAAQLWAELINLGRRDELDRVIRLASTAHSDDDLEHRLTESGLMPTAQDIIRAWYTGAVTIADPGRPGMTETKVVNYNEALVWTACSFTKPPATCGGPFGYWHDGPTA